MESKQSFSFDTPFHIYWRIFRLVGLKVGAPRETGSWKKIIDFHLFAVLFFGATLLSAMLFYIIFVDGDMELKFVNSAVATTIFEGCIKVISFRYYLDEINEALEDLRSLYENKKKDVSAKNSYFKKAYRQSLQIFCLLFVICQLYLFGIY